MIDVNFQKTLSDPRKLNKDLTFIKDVSCKMINNVSMLNPTFIVKFDNALWESNHAYIPLFNRHYFIDKIELVENNKMQISMSVDVLESVKDTLLNSTLQIARQENLLNGDLIDNQIATISDKQISIARFNEELALSDVNSYVLEINGGVYNG